MAMKFRWWLQLGVRRAYLATICHSCFEIKSIFVIFKSHDVGFPILSCILSGSPLADLTDKLEATMAISAKLDQNVPKDQFLWITSMYLYLLA